MSDAVTEDAEYQDDVITLGGIKFPVTGPIVARSIAEFTAGLKIGPATYDEREHAFWLVLEDFSGGFSHRQLNIREAGGTHWDNVGGVDLRRARHITLPALRTTSTPDLEPDDMAINLYKAGSAVYYEPGTGDVNILVGIGDAAYTSENGITMVRRQLLTDYEGFTRLVDFRGSDGNRFVYATGYGVGGPDAAAVEYFRANVAGTAWTAASSIPSSGVTDLRDIIVFDQQLVAETFDNRIISSADGINWSVDASEDPVYRTSHTRVPGARTFVGIAMAPWGQAAPYFLDDGQLFVLDFYRKTASPIEDVGDEFALWTGVAWNGSIWVSDARNIWEYNPGSGATVRYQGPFMGRQGVPPSWNPRGEFDAFPANDDSYYILEFIVGTGDLFALCRAQRPTSTDGTTRLLVFNGTGWSWYGPEITEAFPQASLLYGNRLQIYGRRLVVWTSDTLNDPTEITASLWRLPMISSVPVSHWVETFEDGPLPFELGWIDGGFVDLEGSLYRIEINGYNLTDDETVKIEYRLNNAEEAAYTDLGTIKTNKGVLWFDEDHQGVAFKTVQFRITLDRGAVTTFSPELSSLVLVYDKRPQLRTAWTIRLDLNRMAERGMRIDGEVATIESAWQKLRELWNTPTLLKLLVPSLEGAGINVKMVDLPGTFDDIRTSKRGRGFVDVQLLETVV